MGENLTKYRITINPTIQEWDDKDCNVNINQQLLEGYIKLLVDNKLHPEAYKPILGWFYNGDDFVNNRITLVLTAEPIPQHECEHKFGSHLKDGHGFYDLPKVYHKCVKCGFEL